MRPEERVAEEEEEEEDDDEKKRKWNLFGVVLQVIFFMSNAYVWIIGLACLLGGFMLGFNSRTIILQDFDWLDFIATTPATIFITYGFLMMILTSFGCFAATSGNRILIIIFLVLVILIFIFDLFAGIWAYFSIYSLPNFVKSLEKSLQGFGITDTEWVGIIRLHPTTYWNHVQLRARCCGVYQFDDWFNTPIGRNWSLPDSCCNEDYEHEYCGHLLLRHPDSEHHAFTHIINTNGLMRKFPKALGKAFMESGYIGISVGIAIILAFIAALIVLILVCLKKYKAGGGPESRANPYYRRERTEQQGDGDNKNWFSNVFKKKNRVAPTTEPGRNDRNKTNPKSTSDDFSGDRNDSLENPRENFRGGERSKRRRSS